MSALTLWVEGIGAWAPGFPDWARLRAALREEGGACADMPPRPTPQRLAAGERRRVPVSVLMAIEAASQAVAMSTRDAATLPSLFVSAHGDGPVLDYMCATLAQAPTEMSPIRFHNSVHNAAAGYWTIATGCHAASCASSALESSFGASLLEVAVQTLADRQPVLLVASDVAGVGPLAEVIASTAPFACALVLAPAHSTAAVARLELSLQSGIDATVMRRPAMAALAAGNLAARGLPLLESLAGVAVTSLTLAAADRLGLTIHTEMIA